MSVQLHKGSLWVGIWQAALGLFVGLIVSSFIFGRSTGDLRQKITDVVEWKADTMPRIEKIDRGGSISFENFKQQYDKEQSQQYVEINKLKEAVSHLETMNLRINRLERRVGIDGNERNP
jgi:hypothetical protein